MRTDRGILCDACAQRGIARKASGPKITVKHWYGTRSFDLCKEHTTQLKNLLYGNVEFHDPAYLGGES